MTPRGPAPLPDLTPSEYQRYARHLILPEVGLAGQRRLKGSRVLLVGAGGLGSPVALYLAAAGVGHLGLVDFDDVDASNLQRQILHGTRDVGRPKLDSARDRLHDLNPEVHLEAFATRLDRTNALELVRDHDLVVDGTDNFATRYLTNDACVLTGRPNVYGSIFRFEGQSSVFATAEGPCYRCLFPDPPPPGQVPSCAEGGVLGVLPGLLGVVQATSPTFPRCSLSRRVRYSRSNRSTSRARASRSGRPNSAAAAASGPAAGVAGPRSGATESQPMSAARSHRLRSSRTLPGQG